MTKVNKIICLKTKDELKKLKQKVKPFVMNSYCLIAFGPSGSKVLDKVTFDVAIVKGRLQITSSQRIRR